MERICTFHKKCKLLSFQSNILNKHCVIYLSSLHCHKLSILFQAQYFLFVSSQHILNKDDFLWVMNSKDDIFLLLNLRTSEGLMFFITKLGLSPPGKLRSSTLEWGFCRQRSTKIPLCPTWPINLLDRCTATQSPLAHRTFQGVKCPSPTGPRGSHLSIAVNKYWLFR